MIVIWPNLMNLILLQNKIDNLVFDLSKTKALGQLKQYQIKKTQNRNKMKPFVY